MTEMNKHDNKYQGFNLLNLISYEMEWCLTVNQFQNLKVLIAGQSAFNIIYGFVYFFCFFLVMLKHRRNIKRHECDKRKKLNSAGDIILKRK